MLLSDWLDVVKINNSGLIFQLYLIDEIQSYDIAVTELLSNLLVNSHGNPIKIKEDCKKLVEDAKNKELYIFEKYITEEYLESETQLEQKIIEKYLIDHVIPGESKVSTRIGNFGEVIAAEYSLEFEKFWLPIYKLRYREKKDWASRLTDLCLIKKDDEKIPLVCYVEVKTNSANLKKNLGVTGHDSLVRDDALADPEILEFISRQFYNAEKFDEGGFFSDLQLGRISYETNHEVFLIHESEIWSDEILTNLNEHDINPNLKNFTVRVFLINGLRNLIDSSYRGSWEAVQAVLNE